MSENAAWSERIVEWAKRFHVEYEYQAKRFGWESQTPVDFDDLPEANKQTMLNTVAAVMGSAVYPLEREIARLRAEPPSALAPRECGYGKLGVEDRAHKIWAANFNFCPDCGAALDDKGESDGA